MPEDEAKVCLLNDFKNRASAEMTKQQQKWPLAQ
jgi:hypothetical protein